MECWDFNRPLYGPFYCVIFAHDYTSKQHSTFTCHLRILELLCQLQLYEFSDLLMVCRQGHVHRAMDADMCLTTHDVCMFMHTHVHTQTHKSFSTVHTPLAFWSVIELIVLCIVQLVDVHHKLYVVVGI